MNNRLKYFVLLAVIPLLTIGLTIDYVIEIDAMKSVGSKNPDRTGVGSFGSKTSSVVCGDRLCSEYEDGRAGYESGADPITTPSEEPIVEEVPTIEEEVPPIDESSTIIEETIMQPSPGDFALSLARANVPATIPLHQGYYNGGAVYFIVTDSSDPKHAEVVTKQQGWKVEAAPVLVNSPKEILSPVYIFENGVNGAGVYGFQSEVFSSTPAQENYNALASHTHVIWNDDAIPKILDSVDAILFNEDEGLLRLVEHDIVTNMPQIVWPEGQMKVKKDSTVTDFTPFVGGQVLDINIDEMTVTFIAHRGWGPDGRTIYFIVTDATPSGPAEMMGVIPVTASAGLISNLAAGDFFHFRNGVSGSGPLGFQPGIAASALGDETYSPMWRIFFIGWNDDGYMPLLQTIGDINFYKEHGLIDVDIARPMDSDHIVNAPFVDPFQ